MTYQVRNIIVGAAALYVSAKDSTTAGYTIPALPAGTAVTPLTAALDADTTNWRHTGFTSEGLELAYEPDYGDIEVDQLLDSAKIFKQALKVSINTTLSEASLENLLVSWGASNATNYTASAVAADITSFGIASIASGDSALGVAAGALGDEPVERALIAVGPAPRNVAASNNKRERVYYARRVLSVESSSHALRRNEATVFPVSFRLLPDPTMPVGKEYGIIRDRNIT